MLNNVIPFYLHRPAIVSANVKLKQLQYPTPKLKTFIKVKLSKYAATYTDKTATKNKSVARTYVVGNLNFLVINYCPNTTEIPPKNSPTPSMIKATKVILLSSSFS